MKTRLHFLFIVLALLALSRPGSAQGTADLRLSASGPAGVTATVNNVVYTLSITNSGPLVATGVVLSNQLPSGVTFVSATVGIMPTNGVLLLNLGTLAVGTNISFQIVEVANPGFPAQSLGQPVGQLTNTFQVNANQTNSIPGNNSASVVTTVVNAVPGTPMAGFNPGTQFIVTTSTLLPGPPSSIQVGEERYPAVTCQPGDVVLLTETNDYANPTNWAAVARFFNPNDPTGTNGLWATHSQVFFPTNFSSNSFRLFPGASFIPAGTITTSNGITSIDATYDEIGPYDAILGGQTDVNLLSVSPLLLAISHTNNEAIVTWSPPVTGWTLQTNHDLTTGAWGNYTGAVGYNSATNSPLAGNVYFRLTQPSTYMSLIPAGSFTMGDTLDGESDALPTNVYVSGFYMDVNLVTYDLWQSVSIWATNNGYGFDNAGLSKAANHPVQTVNWFDCVKWCNARSQQVGLTPVYYADAGFTTVYTNGEVTSPYVNWSANGYRLPTEAEWEKAARGGLSGQRFPWGLTISESQANYFGTNSFSYDLGPNGYNAIGNYPTTSPGTSPVGSFPANGYGLNDMAGNVLEWCWDWYAGPTYPVGSPYLGGTDPRGPVGPLGVRVLRGGGWYTYANYARCAYRVNSNPGGGNYNIGFRCVRGL